MSWLGRLLGRGAFPPPAPEGELAVIGDLHGRADLLARMFERIEAEQPDATVVTVGDYVDRGPDSRAVLEMVRQRPGLVALRGNHEAMMLGFLDDPELEAQRWLRVGGRETLQSYGITPPDCAADRAPAAAALRAALGGTEDWLRGLPTSWRSGEVLVSHAGADPARSPDDQDEHVLLWGHPAFAQRRRRDGVWVVHGHNVVDSARARGGRVAVDTGAWKTGRLTAAVLAAGEPVTFIEVRDGA